MPIYEYKCSECGSIVEAMQKFSDPPLKECSCCHGELHKIVSMSTFHLKGSGWYTTDYSGKNQSTSSTAKSESASGPSAEKKTESSTAVKE